MSGRRNKRRQEGGRGEMKEERQKVRSRSGEIRTQKGAESTV